MPAVDEYTPWGYTLLHMRKDIQKATLRRLKILAGQIKGIEKMVEEEKYCIDIINQAEAAREALSGVRNLILKNHLSTHVVDQMREGQEDKAVSEMMRVYERIGKR